MARPRHPVTFDRLTLTIALGAWSLFWIGAATLVASELQHREDVRECRANMDAALDMIAKGKSGVR